MEKRQLGRTGHMSSVVILGTAAFGRAPQEEADAALDLALARGVNHIDVAPTYGDAELRVGAWLGPHRDQFFLGCKTTERTRDGAWDQLQHSLERLRVDRLDLHQFHSVGTFEELDQITAPGGAFEAFVRARDEGLTKYLGITGHGLLAPAVHAEAVRRMDLDTVLFPINPNLYANPDYRRDTEGLLQLAAERDLGVLIIKSVAKGLWHEDQHKYDTWYEPFDRLHKIIEGVRFALSQPRVTGICSAGDTRILPMVLAAAEAFTLMSATEQVALIEQWAELESVFPGPLG